MEWFVKKDDGTIYGPISLGELKSWAAEGRVAPEDSISADRENWSSPSEKRDLHMDWTLDLGDGGIYGPIHLLAFADFAIDGSVGIAATVRNIRHDVNYPLADVLIPALAESNSNLRDNINALAAELSEIPAEPAQPPAPPEAPDEAARILDETDGGGGKTPDSVKNIAGEKKKSEHWEVLYRQESERSEQRESELQEKVRELRKDKLELTTELDDVRSQLSQQEKLNAEFERFAQTSEQGGDDRVAVLKGQFKHLLDTYHQVSRQYEKLSVHVSEQAAELDELRKSRETVQQHADKRIHDMETELQREREEADKARTKLSSFEKNYTDLLKSYREMNDQLVHLRQKL